MITNEINTRKNSNEFREEGEGDIFYLKMWNAEEKEGQEWRQQKFNQQEKSQQFKSFLFEQDTAEIEFISPTYSAEE